MVTALTIDYKDLERVAANLGAAQDQIPFAMALALNQATELARSYLIRSTWPTHVSARNPSFIAASLTTKDTRASKVSLSAEIYDRLDRGHLLMHAKGGVRAAKQGTMAVPVQALREQRGPTGVPGALKPKRLGGRAVRIKDALYVRDKKGRLKLIYVLKARTPIPKRVPFFEDYKAIMERALKPALVRAVERAMATRRR